VNKDLKHRYESPLGEMTVTSDGTSIVGLCFDSLDVFKEQNLPLFNDVDRWLDAYFSGVDPGFMPPVDFRATGFRREVWEILLTIPYGETMSYGEIASIIARRRGIPKMSAQAVGGAVGRNPISIIVPCHRVIGSDGSLVGYGGGLDRKLALLKLERALLL